MRWAVIGDVHANLPALEAVLAALADERIDGWLCPGDLVGYGPMPNEVVARVQPLGATTVAGNHDLIALGELTTEQCGPTARTTLEWTREALGAEARAALAELPRRASVPGVVVAHGSIDDPQTYVRGADVAVAQLERLAEVDADARVLLLGHTHEQFAFAERRGELLEQETGIVSLDPGERILLNAGSVGQSRDRWPRARFMILDLDRGEADFRSIRYDTGAVRRALREAGLPDDAHHLRPTASAPLAKAIVRRVPRPLRRAYRRVRRAVVR